MTSGGGYKWSPCAECGSVALRQSPHEPFIRCAGCHTPRPECDPEWSPEAPKICGVVHEYGRCEMPEGHISARRWTVRWVR